MLRALARIAALGTLMALTGCKMNVTSDLYTSDIRIVATDQAADLTTPGTLAMQIPSKDDCAEYAEKLSAIVGPLVIGFTPKGCESAEMDSFLLADIQIPIVSGQEGWAETDTLFAIIANQAAPNKDIAVFLSLDRDKMRALNDRIDDEFLQRLDLSDSRIALVLNNDERGDATIWTNGVFVNGEPMHNNSFGGIEVTIPRRARIEIVLSNVSAAWIEQHGTVLVLALALE